MFSKITNGGSALVLIGVIAMLALLAGCSSKSVNDDTTSSSGSQLAISASPSSFEVNATSVIEATVTTNSTGVPDQVVHFSAEPVSAGYFTPDSAVTDNAGVAACVFTATSSGSVRINATTDVASSPVATYTYVSVAEAQQSGQGNINITVSQSLLLANGSDTSVVTVTARDPLGQPVPDGTAMVLVAGEKFVDIDGNGIWSYGIDSLVYDANGNGNWDPIGQIPSNAVAAGGAGQATVNYIAGQNAGTVYLKATITDPSLAASAEKSIQLSPNATVNSIYLHSDSLNLVVRGTGGIETSILEATAYDIYGNPVPEGLPISFIITDGPGGGERLDTVGYGPYNTVTNSQGMASVPIQSGTASGTVRIRAYHQAILSNATQIVVSAGPPAHVVIGTEYCNIDLWNTVGEEVGITAVVSDIYLNPVNDNTAVYFSTDEGTMKSHEARTQNLEGVAVTKWISGNNVPTADGVVVVRVETSGGTVADTGFFLNTWVTDTIVATGMPATMPADGSSKAVVNLFAFDVNGNAVVDNTSFDADAAILGVSGGSFNDGCLTSSARTKVTSSTLETDGSLTGGNDDGIGAVDNVYYWSAGAMSVYPVQLTTGPAYSANCEVAGTKTVSLGETAHLSVIIRDRFGNPLGDHTVVMSAATGTPGGTTQNTNAYGEAAGFTWVPADTGSVNVVFSDTDPRGGIVLTQRISVTQ